MRGLIQNIRTSELTAEADDAETARALVEEQLPEGFELTQVHNAMPRGGRVIATAVIRPATITEIEAEGDDYETARDALRAAVPADHRLLAVVVAD